MKTDRLRRIIKYSDTYRHMIESKVKDFYSFAGMNCEKELLNIMQIVRPSFEKKGYLVLELPFADEEIGAFYYKGDGIGYIVLNTSLPKVNVNFALCHELYHVFYQGSSCETKVEFGNDHCFEHEEEFAANLFAGMLLMPESSFRFMYHKFKQDSGEDIRDIILRLMNYYQTPYMAVLIRCYELGLPETDHIPADLLNSDKDRIRERFIDLWLDDSILNGTKKDDYIHLEEIVARMGKECIGTSYLSEKTLNKVLQNMRALYSEIKGD